MEQRRARAGAPARVFLVQDTAELNFTNHPSGLGWGPIGQGGVLQGLHQQNVPAIDPAVQRPSGWLRPWRGGRSFQLILVGAELYRERDGSNGG